MLALTSALVAFAPTLHTAPRVSSARSVSSPTMLAPPGFGGGVIGGAVIALGNKLLAGKSIKQNGGPVTEAEVLAAQKLWSESIEAISDVHAAKGDFVAAAGEAAGKLYGYGHHPVLFKPTKATNHPFRPTGEDAMSYFVGADAMKNAKFVGEDGGFAINGGRGWKDVTFRNHKIELYGDIALAMGDYLFTDATDGSKARVEYTFGYKRCEDGVVRIALHHSSVPYAA